MNRHLKKLIIGAGSVLNIFPSVSSSHYEGKSYLSRIRQPVAPRTSTEAAEFNAAAIRSDWQMVGDALLHAASDLHDHP